jgi:hypothetical protein
MNIHVPQEIRDRWPAFEFEGVPRVSKHGFIYQQAFHKILGDTYFYVYGADSFVCRDSIRCGASELIFDDNFGLEWAKKYI